MTAYLPQEHCDLCERKCLAEELFPWGEQYLCDMCLRNLDKIDEEVKQNELNNRMKGGRDG